MKKEKDKKGKKRGRSLSVVGEEEQDALLSHALQLVGGKWKLRILLVLGSAESLRYGEIRSRVAGITDMMLSQSLKNLCASGLIQRQQFQQIPPRVEYRLTEQASGALEAAVKLCSWAKHL
jgi:DNA-binding HxlR family transcriptional regulator